MNIEELALKLANFRPITLEEMGKMDVGLLNRIDTKYLVTAEDFSNFLEILKAEYRVFEIGNSRLHRYETLYFDTDKHDFYYMHHNQKGNRLKVRIRKYVENNLIFLEVKRKTNKSVTLKKRISLPYFPTNLMELKTLIEEAGIDIAEEELKPQLWTCFRRMTFVHPDRKERLTIDVDLHIKNGESDMTCADLVIIELKRDKSETESAVLDLMKSLQIKEQGFSKYTIGTALISEEVRKNNFKHKLYELKNRFSFETEAIEAIS